MWYMIYGIDAEGSLDKRKTARPAHLERLKALQDDGRLMLAGPLPALDTREPGPLGFVGSLIVAEFDSLQDAKAWAETDPYVQAGVYREVHVHPWLQVFPSSS
ncbi:MAG: YciI family protein [Halothiobacillaceae bacterium]